MRKKCIVFMLVLSLALLYPLSKSEGVFGIGDVVFDPSNIIQMVIDYALQLEHYAQLIAQYQMLVKQYENMVLNIAALGVSMVHRVMNPMSQLTAMLDKVEAIPHRISSTVARFEQLYPSFGAHPLSGTDLVQKLRAMAQQMRGAAKLAMQTQSVIEAIQGDQVTLDGAMRRSDAAVGNLQVQQAGNQINGLNTLQLIRMQQMLAAQGRIATSRVMADATMEDQAQLNADRWMMDFAVVPHTTGLSALPRLR